jgi:alpha-L-fucosidase
MAAHVTAGIAVLMLCAPALRAQSAAYQPDWASLDRRPIPAWFDEAKFGIFIHWGVYSVPAWGPRGKESGWYGFEMNKAGSPTAQFHAATYGEHFTYADFAEMFKAELFDAAEWARLLQRAGARYVVLTAKHHDGYCLWPSAMSPQWNSMDTGPHRDLVGELTKAVRDRGLRMGLYYSLYEWYHPLLREHRSIYTGRHMFPQLTELVESYAPDLLFADGEWDYNSRAWKSREFLAWLFNESAVREHVVINDRWGNDTRSRHGGYFTSEYGHVDAGKKLDDCHKWEECRAIGKSFIYNRSERAEDYRGARELVHLLVDTVSRGGNLLLDVGPAADGRIPVIMQERLVEIGEWLKVNGEAIYRTKPWRESKDGDAVRYTAGQNGVVYAISLGWPGRELVLSVPKARAGASATLLGRPDGLKTRTDGGKLIIEVPPLSVEEVPCQHAYAFKLTGVE